MVREHERSVGEAPEDRDRPARAQHTQKRACDVDGARERDVELRRDVFVGVCAPSARRTSTPVAHTTWSTSPDSVAAARMDAGARSDTIGFVARCSFRHRLSARQRREALDHGAPQLAFGRLETRSECAGTTREIWGAARLTLASRLGIESGCFMNPGAVLEPATQCRDAMVVQPIGRLVRVRPGLRGDW